MAGKGARSRFEIRIFNITQYYDAIWQDMYLKMCVCNIGAKLTHFEEKISTKCHDMVDIKAFVRAAGFDRNNCDLKQINDF